MPTVYSQLGPVFKGPLTGQRIAVVGATGARGGALTAALVRAGACVAAFGRDAAKLDALLAREPALDLAMGLDLSDPVEVEVAVAALRDRYGGVDAVWLAVPREAAPARSVWEGALRPGGQARWLERVEDALQLHVEAPPRLRDRLHGRLREEAQDLREAAHARWARLSLRLRRGSLSRRR